MADYPNPLVEHSLPGQSLALASVAAFLTTALAGANNDLTFTAAERFRGDAGNTISVTYVVAGANTPLSVSVSGRDITVNVATNGSSVATSTAAQVATAVNADANASQLVTATNAASNDGTGVVTALSKTNLATGSTVLGSPWSSGTRNPAIKPPYN